MFNNIILLATALVMLILFAMIVVGAFQYLMARGNPDAMSKAQNTIKWAFIGLLLFMSSYLILNIIQYLFIGDPSVSGTPSLLKFEIPTFKPGSATP